MTTNDEPKRRGKARSGKPRNRMLPFSVTPEDEEWLLTLPNRSEWLREQIELVRGTSAGTRRGQIGGQSSSVEDEGSGFSAP